MRHQFTYGLPEDARALREVIFMKEQRFVEEFDALDDHCYHVVQYMEEVPCATGRLYEEDGVYHIGRICVKQEYRKQHLGSNIVGLLEQKAQELHGDTIVITAQVQAIGFYEKLGYQPIGEEFLEEHCRIRTMVKHIKQSF